MKKLLLAFCITLWLIEGFSQPYNPEKVNKKAKELYQQAIERAEDGNIASATGLLLKCVEIDNKFADAFLSLGGVYGQLKNYNTSITYYEKAFAID